jgi:hypothetical protein
VLQEDKSHALDTRRLLEAAIYALICDIGRDSNVSEEHVNLLAQDTNFTILVEQAHISFNRGYKRLMSLRRNSG